MVAGYGGGNVLQGVDLEVGAGAIACIVGPNGAGKSTVLRAVSGLLKPRAGRILLDGRASPACARPSAADAASPRCRSATGCSRR